MGIVGIVAEYNPFHNGHAYLISEAKKQLGASHVIVIMSGSFVQRGEPAVANKFTRAEWAVLNGADMVIELPEVFSLACAERFASGAIRILKGAGIVDCICFGSECGDLSALKKAAQANIRSAEIRAALKGGVSYPRAVSEAFDAVPLSNDILGIEYIRAIGKYAPNIVPHAIKRTDSGYNSDDIGNEFSSAKAIRGALQLCSGSLRISEAYFAALSRSLPRNVLDSMLRLMKQGSFPSTDSNLSDAILYRLRGMDTFDICNYPEVSEGLENLFSKRALDSSDYHEMLSKVKSKRYTMARLKRIAMNIFLGIDATLQDDAATNDSALYVRILAVSKNSNELISMVNKQASCPVIIKAEEHEALTGLASKVNAIARRAHSLQSLSQPYVKETSDDRSHRLIVT